MSTHRYCCCDDDCQGVIGFDIYTTQIQSFSHVPTDGPYFNKYPVKDGEFRDVAGNQLHSGFDTWEWPYDGAQHLFEARTPHYLNSNRCALNSGYRDWYVECPWPGTTNVNKDPVDTNWTTPLGLRLQHGLQKNQTFTWNRFTFNDPGAGFYSTVDMRDLPHYDPNKYKNSPFRVFLQNHFMYGQAVDEHLSAAIMPYLFTSQPGRFVMQTHSEIPGNHYVGLDETGCLACLPYPEDHPNYWANPLNHLSPKTPLNSIQNNFQNYPTSFADWLYIFGGYRGGNILSKRDIVDTKVVEPWRNAKIFAAGLLSFSRSNLYYGHSADWAWKDLYGAPANFWPRFRTTLQSRFDGLDFLFDSFLGPNEIIYNMDNAFTPPLPQIIDPRSLVRPEYPWGGVIAGFELNEFSNMGNSVLSMLFPCKLTAFEVEMWTKDGSYHSSYDKRVYPDFVSTENPGVPWNIPYTLPWTSRNTWKRNNPVTTLDPTWDQWPLIRSPKGAERMPDKPPFYFKMPKRGKLFTGPLFAQNRWEQGGAYFGKYADRGHYSNEKAVSPEPYNPEIPLTGVPGTTKANWTQAGWLTWSGNTSAPTSLLTDPENKMFFDAEVAAFKRMVDCCATEANKTNNCVNGKRVVSCNDLSTKLWKKKYPNMLCTDPPPPCGARKLVWTLYQTEEGNETLTGYFDGVPLAWGDLIINEDKQNFANSTYEMVTKWTLQDYYKNRCDGFDAGPGGTASGMTYREMMGLDWTPLYPVTKNLKKEIIEKEWPEGSPPTLQGPSWPFWKSDPSNLPIPLLPYATVPWRYVYKIRPQIINGSYASSPSNSTDPVPVRIDYADPVSVTNNGKAYTGINSDNAWGLLRNGYFRSFQSMPAGFYWFYKKETLEAISLALDTGDRGPEAEQIIKGIVNDPSVYDLGGFTHTFVGDCGTLPYWYWYEDSDNIEYFPNCNLYSYGVGNFGDPLNGIWGDRTGRTILDPEYGISWVNHYQIFNKKIPQFVWVISCSVPQYHKKADQPKTKDGVPVDGELTGLGDSKNMGMFNPCKLDYYGVSGPETVEIVSGITFPNMTRDVKSAYKTAHGCTWCNESIFVKQVPDSDTNATLESSHYFSTPLIFFSTDRDWDGWFSYNGNSKTANHDPEPLAEVSVIDDYSYTYKHIFGLCLDGCNDRGHNGFGGRWRNRCSYAYDNLAQDSRIWQMRMYAIREFHLAGYYPNEPEEWTPTEFKHPNGVSNLGNHSYETMQFTDVRVPYKIGAADNKYFIGNFILADGDPILSVDLQNWFERQAINSQDSILFGRDVPFPDRDNACAPCAANVLAGVPNQTVKLGACCQGPGGDCEDGLTETECVSGNDGEWKECQICSDNPCR